MSGKETALSGTAFPNEEVVLISDAVSISVVGIPIASYA